jgi:hypothetical protein
MVKIPLEEILQIFTYLDKDKDGFINYNDFCNISEERRMEIDPFIDPILPLHSYQPSTDDIKAFDRSFITISKEPLDLDGFDGTEIVSSEHAKFLRRKESKHSRAQSLQDITDGRAYGIKT